MEFKPNKVLSIMNYAIKYYTKNSLNYQYFLLLDLTLSKNIVLLVIRQMWINVEIVIIQKHIRCMVLDKHHTTERDLCHKD